LLSIDHWGRDLGAYYWLVSGPYSAPTYTSWWCEKPSFGSSQHKLSFLRIHCWCLLFWVCNSKLLNIFLLDAKAQKREQQREWYVTSVDAINAKRRERYAHKKASEAATLQTNDCKLLNRTFVYRSTWSIIYFVV
jgi:hypothetical protein